MKHLLLKRVLPTLSLCAAVFYDTMYYSTAASTVRLKQSSHLLSRIYLQRITHTSHVGQIRAQVTSTWGKSPTIKKKRVAGSFIFKIPNGDHTQAKVALFRRSNKVLTYAHKLAPCSGSVESHDASPLAAALREIQEETTLPASSLDLLRIGKPYSFVDEAVGREWIINPFAFRLKDKAEGGGGRGEEGIALDWEHVGVEWFDPMQVSASDGFGGVPRLVDSLRRVWLEYDLGLGAGGILSRDLQRLRDDHKTDAEELPGMAVSVLRSLIYQLGHHHPIDKNWWSKVRMTAWHICQARPSMDTEINSAMAESLDTINAVYTQDLTPADKIEHITEALDKQAAAVESVIRPKYVGNHIKKYFEDL